MAETKGTGPKRKVLLALDGSANSDYALKCEYKILCFISTSFVCVLWGAYGGRESSEIQNEYLRRFQPAE